MNKKKMMKILYIYLAVIAFLIFFSKTIYNFSLPSVNVSGVSSGCLEKSIEGFGELNFIETHDIFSDIGGQITEVYLNENEKILKSSSIVKVEYVPEQAEIQKIESSLEKSKLSVSTLETDKSTLQREIEKLKMPENNYDDVFNLEVQTLENKIKNQIKVRDIKYSLYQHGSIPKQEYDDEVQILDELESELKLKYADNEKILVEDEKSRIEKIENKESEVEKIENEIREIQLDIQLTESELLSIKKGETQIVKSSFNEECVILKMHVQEGEFISKGAKIATVGIIDKDFYIEISEKKESSSFIAVGDKASFSSEGASTDARVVSIKQDGENVNIRFNISSADFKVGTYGRISMTKISPEYDILIPNEAVVKEEFSYYVWILKSKQGSLGNTYYAKKARIFISDNDENYTAVAKGLTYMDDIIIDAPSDLENNERVLPY